MVQCEDTNTSFFDDCDVTKACIFLLALEAISFILTAARDTLFFIASSYFHITRQTLKAYNNLYYVNVPHLILHNIHAEYTEEAANYTCSKEHKYGGKKSICWSRSHVAYFKVTYETV